MKQDLINSDLFGNEAGDDEDLEVLNGYFVAKPEFERFFNPAQGGIRQISGRRRQVGASQTDVVSKTARR